jgi:hypothetical protein
MLWKLHTFVLASIPKGYANIVNSTFSAPSQRKLINIQEGLKRRLSTVLHTFALALWDMSVFSPVASVKNRPV